jgi:hypothetical protein
VGRAGYLREHFKAVTAAELVRRRALRVALEATLAGAKGARLLVTAVRRHLAEFHGAAYAGLPLVHIVRACRGLARWRGGGRRTVLLGVKLRRPGVRSLAARWEARLRREGMEREPALIRRSFALQAERADVDNPESAVHHPGLLVRSQGVWMQTVDHSVTVLTADTRNGDGSRGRMRRHVSYYQRLQKAATRAALTRRERLIVDVLVAGGTWRDVGKRLELGKSRIHEVVRDLHRKLGVRGPGAGR